jgi:hypothetical protein
MLLLLSHPVTAHRLETKCAPVRTDRDLTCHTVCFCIYKLSSFDEMGAISSIAFLFLN